MCSLQDDLHGVSAVNDMVTGRKVVVVVTVEKKTHFNLCAEADTDKSKHVLAFGTAYKLKVGRLI